MKPTVGLTTFCCLMNLCEKKWVWGNEKAGFPPFKKHDIWRVGQKTIFPTKKKGCFSALINTGLQPGGSVWNNHPTVSTAYPNTSEKPLKRLEIPAGGFPPG